MQTPSQELWTFSLLVPGTQTASDERNNGEAKDDTDSNNSNGDNQKPELIQLQRHFAEDDPRRSSASLPLPNTTTNFKSLEIDEYSRLASTSGTSDERTSLLTEEQGGGRDASSSLSTTGWTFSSPFWSIQSTILLKMTYKPAWQVLPGYTNNKCSHKSSALLLGTAGSNAAVCCCCGCLDSSDPFHSITFTTLDIVRTEKIPSLNIRAAGECSAVRVYLKYPTDCFQLVVPDNVPQQFQSDWEEQLENICNSREESAFFQEIKSEIDKDAQEGDSLEVTDHWEGPTITFALPKDTYHDDDEPALLWKVEVPPPKGGPIALESLTVMDGPLISKATTSSSDTKSYKPTHLYVNGYQSWSFAGSVPIGQPQPKSAMPDVFSKAFNYGGTLPPPTIEYVPPFTRQDARFPVYNRPHPESPYVSDFFTCISSHEHTTEEEHTERHLRGPKLIHRPLDEKGGPALVLGWLSQRQQFGVVSVDQQLQRLQLHSSHQGQLVIPRKDAGGSIVQTDWAFAQLESPATYDEEPLVHYLRAVAGYNQAKPLQNGPLLTGWCSWYHYYENISEESLRANFAKLAGLRKTCPTNVSVVDDGYMTAWGDWDSLKPNKFSSTNSMKAVADDIRAQKMRPGIWLAPFACDKHSILVQEHPDWIIRNDQGIPANSSNCGKFFYGLDAGNPEVLEYVYKCIRRAVKEWGFVVLKIDFLYAAGEHFVLFCAEHSSRPDQTYNYI